MEFDSNWQEQYAGMVRSPEKALKEVRSGQRVFIGTGCGEPTELVKALTARAGELSDVEIIQLFTKGDASYAQRKYADCFRLNSFFIGQNVRNMIQEGLGSYTPILLSNIPHLFNTGLLPIDVALIQTTPPNRHGKVSLGISVDIVKSATENASLIIAQVNPQMPWTQGDSVIDIYDIDILVPADVPLIEREDESTHEISRMIGRNIATLVPDGATIQFGLGRMQGLGRLPHATMEFLADKKDLGIHSEMITNSILALIRSGAVNGSRKSSDRGRIVTSFCMGTKELYDAVNDNPLFCFRPTEYVNDFRVISQQTRMVAINMAQEIDLTGQICSDSQAGMLYSGIGGLVDFNRGATVSKEGKSIVALPSTNLEGTRSNIMTQLSPGSGVSITRGAVSYVVTEYGVAYLYGKSVQERVMALIAIAHPNFREQLFREAIEAHYIRPDMARVGDKIVLPTDETMRTVLLLEDGTQMTIRSIQPTDEPLMRDLVYTLSRETIYYRFMSSQVAFSHRQIQDFVYVDHRKDVAIVGTVPEAHGEDIIAVGRYYLDEKTNRAEVAFVVRDDWQGKRIGTFLFKHLTDLAKRNGIAGFTAEVLRDNIRMQTIFNHSGHRVQTRLQEGVYSFVIDF
ncbi:MAG: GNAT family N-acetyltransferase [Desulfoprunum sp.]|uniref:bifunctional acetyl-CoA hydrolase/transferase family protein/GNAT family N-acetyltransferase n=1 Tax=Desulfoprunum sp. TaxID=2020866 RepID=UPI00052B77F1|nr:4-hydroxybutyrate CoA-transferase [Desulfobulbus sp. Tol-SR]